MFNYCVDKSSPIPYYFQIEEWIRGLIAGGQLKPGDMLMNEISLSEQLGVSRMTVRQALNNLTNEGVLVRQRAKGTFIAPPRAQVPFARDQLRSLTEEVAATGRQVYSRVLTQELQPPTGEMQRELHIAPADRLILIRRLRYVEEGPVTIENTYHPYNRFPELLTIDLNDQSIYSILEEKFHARPVEAIDTIVAGIASGEEARLLEIEIGAPVMRYKRVAFDATGRPMEFTRAIYRADRYQFVIRYQRS
jgi:GntR family transcriptional regulator